MVNLHGSVLTAKNGSDRQKLDIEAPLRSWSFLSVTLVCLGCILAEGVLAWKYSTSTLQFANVPVAIWILAGWLNGFRYRKTAHELFREPPTTTELAIEKPASEIEPAPDIGQALHEANRAIDNVLFYTSLAILMLLVQVFFLLSGHR